MKFRHLMFTALLALMVMFTSCNGCGTQNQDEQVKEDTTEVVVGKLNVEHAIALNRQTVYNNYSQDYRWYESGIVMENWLDEDNASADVHSTYNIFQFMTDETGRDPMVLLFANIGDKVAVDPHPSAFYVGNMPLNDEEIEFTFEEAFNRLMEANVVKPHSKQCVLRRELGPKPNVPAQYIFGNIDEHVYVDAKTGEVRTTNPAYEGFESLNYAFTW